MSDEATTQDERSIDVLGALACDAFSVHLSHYRTSLRQNWHSHDEPILILLLAGYTREQVGSRDIVANPLDVGIKPAGVRHTDQFWANGVRALRIVLNASLLGELKELSRITERWEWISGSEAVSPLLRSAAVLQRLNKTKTDVQENVYDALAALLPQKPPRNGTDAPSWLRHARDHLETSYASGIRLTHLAREADLHPVYFARQFRRFFGCSVGSYLQKLKTRRTAHLLASQSCSLAQIASLVGFSDQAHMTRSFVSQFGITPGQFRRLAR